MGVASTHESPTMSKIAVIYHPSTSGSAKGRERMAGSAHPLSLAPCDPPHPASLRGQRSHASR
jgi:hypothetical protein